MQKRTPPTFDGAHTLRYRRLLQSPATGQV